MINNLKMKWKLLLGFGIVIILSCSMAVISYYTVDNINKSYNNTLDGSVSRSVSMLNVGRTYALYRRLAATAVLRSGEADTLNNLIGEYNSLKTDMSNAFDGYFAALEMDIKLNQDEKKTRKELVESLQSMINKEYDSIITQIFDHAMRGEKEAADEALAMAATISAKINDDINSLLAMAKTTRISMTGEASNEAGMSKVIILVISGIIIFSSLVIAVVIANIITKRIMAVADAAEKISEGNFDVLVGSNNTDEIAGLSNTLLHLKNTVEKLVDDINHVADEMAKGEVDARLDESSYKGEFNTVSKGFNVTVDSLIEGVLESMGFVTEFGNGNFDVPIKQYPGKKEVLTTSFKAVQANLKKFNQDINDIIDGAAEGNLDVSMDTSQYKGDWNKMAGGVNRLLGAVVKPIREAIDVMNQLSNGNLEVSVNGSYKGEFDKMKSALNNTLTMLASYITEISDVLGSMSGQDLTRFITRQYVGDFAAMRTSINTIVEVFNKLLSEINSAADQVASGANQISLASMTLAQGTTKQASSVEELNATIENIASQTQQNAENAKNASKFALHAKETAESGNKEMKEMLTAMAQINESSGNISKIIKVIDDIAVQTNLLALNAAVEAARAGKHGKGFTVVAEEVRMLASKSQSAAKDTSDLIAGSVERVKEGSQIANKTAQAFETIVSEIVEIVSTVKESAEASIRQSEAIGQVNIGINQISAVTQSNSATSEEQASAAQELSSQAELFRTMVNAFKL